jgi:hypothetical protein
LAACKPIPNVTMPPTGTSPNSNLPINAVRRKPGVQAHSRIVGMVGTAADARSKRR